MNERIRGYNLPTGSTLGEHPEIRCTASGSLTQRLEFTATPTVSTTPAYTAGDTIGSKITLANAVLISGAEASLKSLTITDKSNQKPALEVVIFNADPAGSTFTDNAALVIAAADATKVIARVTVAAGDWVTIGGIGVATVAVDRVLAASGGTTLYAALQAAGTPTFVSTTDITVRFGLEQH